MTRQEREETAAKLARVFVKRGLELGVLEVENQTIAEQLIKEYTNLILLLIGGINEK